MLVPSNPYAATKAAADMLVKSWGRTYGIAWNIVRTHQTTMDCTSILKSSFPRAHGA